MYVLDFTFLLPYFGLIVEGVNPKDMWSDKREREREREQKVILHGRYLGTVAKTKWMKVE